ncbi:hypothetical protein ACLQ2R_27950 [Streptosporangium sp. DT93]|uniref:hypothetical protein n=1 Tax=Streptosporangium sp. DT93 TaxID=3393428 RepID=UPI003CE7A695
MSDDAPSRGEGSSSRGLPAPGGGAGNAARDELAGAQAALVAALVAGGPTPPGFDRERLRVQETSLIAKRRRTVARLRPDLVASLGDTFGAEFHAYARGRPKPRGGSHADAHDFAAHLRASGRLPESPGAESSGREPSGGESVVRESAAGRPRAASRLRSILTRRRYGGS